MRHIVDRLRDQGFRIAIDDAGAGYSGLQTMVEIEPDFIKLDMSLTRHLDRSVVKQKLIGTLRDFCRQAGIALVAEGIETQAQLDALLALGITYGQGFLFARPGSPYPLRQTILPGGAPAATAPRPKSPPSSESDSARKPGATAALAPTLASRGTIPPTMTTTDANSRSTSRPRRRWLWRA